MLKFSLSPDTLAAGRTWICPSSPFRPALQLDTSSCDPMDYSPSSSVHGILQARIQEWVPCPPPGDLPNPGTKHRSLAQQADSLPSEPPGKAISMDWPSHLTRNVTACSLSGRKFPFLFLRDSSEPKRGDSVESEMRCYFRAEASELPHRAVDPGSGNKPTPRSSPDVCREMARQRQYLWAK